jgi:probable HAF family extracellular repeat protein
MTAHLTTCPSQWQDIGTLGGAQANPYGINNRGDVVGSSDTVDGASHPFHWRNGVMTDLAGTGLTAAFRINDHGDIAGQTLADGGYEHVALWRHGTLVDLGTLNGPWSSVRGMNERGDIIGVSATPEFSDTGTAFLWQRGRMTELPGYGDRAVPISINDHGDVAGSLERPDGAGAGAALWRAARLLRIVPPFGDPDTAVATKINNPVRSSAESMSRSPPAGMGSCGPTVASTISAPPRCGTSTTAVKSHSSTRRAGPAGPPAGTAARPPRSPTSDRPAQRYTTSTTWARFSA